MSMWVPSNLPMVDVSLIQISGQEIVIQFFYTLVYKQETSGLHLPFVLHNHP